MWLDQRSSTDIESMSKNTPNTDDINDDETIKSLKSIISKASIEPKTQAERNVKNRSSEFYKIVLTGGPCSGKTTTLARVSSFLRERGFEVMTCPEAFTLIATNGLNINEMFSTIEGMATAVQHTVLDLQISFEDGFETLLRACGKPAVLLCDRGLMDGKAYLPNETWAHMMDQRRFSECDLREGRYNAVFHLVTAAEGAEKFYTLENNEARTETAAEARTLDYATRKAWVGHPKLHVFDNSTDFEGKLQRLVQATATLVGLPSELPRETLKFLLSSEPDLSRFPNDVSYQVFEVEKVYLYEEANNNNAKEEYSFVRKRTHQNGLGSVYGVTTVKRGAQKIELKRIITKREYLSALRNRDMSRHIIRETRISFIWHMQSFNIHVYRVPIDNVCILHAQADKVDLPPFLDIDRRLLDANGDEKYSSYYISLKNKKGSAESEKYEKDEKNELVENNIDYD